MQPSAFTRNDEESSQSSQTSTKQHINSFTSQNFIAKELVDNFSDNSSTTPLQSGTRVVKWNKLIPDPSITFYTKLESENPTGSNKYRAAQYMIEKAFEAGELKEGDTVIETSSGNMAAALALVCSRQNLKFVCVVDPTISDKNLDIIIQHGAYIDMIKQPLDKNALNARLTRVRELVCQNPDYYWINQHLNPDHQLSHFFYTAEEIYQSFGRNLDVICIADETASTLFGIKAYFEMFSPNTQVVAVDIKQSRLYQNDGGNITLPGVGSSVHPAKLSDCKPDKVFYVDERDAVIACYNAMYRENMLINPATGAVVSAIESNPLFFKDKQILTLMMDAPEKYKDSVFNAAWLEKNLKLSNAEISACLA